ncbi:MAG: ribosome maturation factor RimM [Bacteroidota bacterium]
MRPEKYIPLGTIKRIRGLRGQVLLQTAENVIPPENLSVVFLGFGHTMVPYSVEQLAWQVPQAVLKLQGIDSSTAAYDLKGLDVFVTKQATAQASEDLAEPTEIIGYHVVDEREGSLGKVVDIYTPPQQTLLAVNCRAQELLIPYHTDLVKHVNHGRKTILVGLPLGFLEVLD